MGLLTQAKIDRDFTGGIYLPPLGKAPPLDRLESVDYRGPLRLPLCRGSGSPMHLSLQHGQKVAKDAVLACGDDGQCLYAPRAGVLGPPAAAWVDHQPRQPVITLLPPAEENPHHLAAGPESPGTNPFVSLAAAQSQLQRKQKVLEAIFQTGIVDPATGRLFAFTLEKLASGQIQTVIANAVPLEYEINTPLALLHHFPEQIFAGLAILKTWLGADQALMAYPHYFPIDKTTARQWQVQCVPVSEKYPQGTGPSVLGTLRKQGVLKRKHRPAAAAVFSIQILRQIERTVLAGHKSLDRTITVCGDGVARPRHFLAPVGMPLMDLLHAAQLQEHVQCVARKSSLTGEPINPENAVITPLSEAFIVLRQVVHPQPQRCIRCGRCIEYCPARIDPARLLHLAETGRFALAVRMGACSCVECGLCSYLCPSHLRIMANICMIKSQASSAPSAPSGQEEPA